MSKISEHIASINHSGRKVLNIFLTAGFPVPERFIKLALDVLESGADMLEIGIPFSDPLADGPVIQASSQTSLKSGITLTKVLRIAEEIKSKSTKPVILMGYANPILKYGLKNFIRDSLNSGVDGLIVPDVPFEEYDDFWKGDTSIDKILLTTPTSESERVQKLDALSEGFLYCVSMTGTTGSERNFSEDEISNLQRTYKLTRKNKLLAGFGISSPEDVIKFKPYCDGVIVGSAVIKSLSMDDEKFSKTISFVQELNRACK